MRALRSPRSGAGRCNLLWLLVLSPLLSVGCQVIGGSHSSPRAPGDELSQSVVYQGFIEIGGGNLAAALELSRDGRRDVRGGLQTTSGLIADGEGRVSGDTLELELIYGGECPGRMTLRGEWDQDSGTYEGVVTANDCTGKGEGTFRFSST